MAIRRPITFPQKNTLNGSEELYTQYNGVNYKFTLNQISEFITNFTGEWLSKEVIIDNNDLQNISTNPVQLLDENDLASGEYYEIQRISIEAMFNTSPHTYNGDIFFLFKENSGTPFISADGFLKVQATLIETIYDAFYVAYYSSLDVLYTPNTGLYLQSAVNSGGGDTQFKIKVYYNIQSI